MVEEGRLESEKVYVPARKQCEDGYNGKCDVEIEARLDKDWETIKKNYASAMS
ncbi:MAG: hypothetical protein ABEJ56_02090 [Candidatus Nanohaloarchaea archaeon]